jgi:hypothetical protein
MAPRRTLYIGDQRWKLCRSRRTMPKWYGECNYETRTITVCKSLAGIDLLDTLIHEVIHARWPDLSEEAVEEVATLLAHVLDAEGFVHADD